MTTETPSGIMVTMRDIRAARMCSSGARRWFAENGIDWTEFLKRGVPVERLEATGDALGLKVAEVARGRK